MATPAALQTPTLTTSKLVVWALLLLFPCSLAAVSPNLSLSQYLHTTWTQEDGTSLPSVWTLAQTDDGYLWLGTNDGLMRFDGLRFVEWTPTSGPGLPVRRIGWLSPASGDGLWVATVAGVYRIDRGRVYPYPSLGKAPCQVVLSGVRSLAGRDWILGQCAGQYWVTAISPEGKVEKFGTADGLPNQPLSAILRGPRDTLSIVTSSAICRWSPGHQAECSDAPGSAVSAAVEDVRGQMAVIDAAQHQVFRASDGKLAPVGRHIDAAILRTAFLYDRDGNIWIGTAGQGVLRVHGDQVDRFTSANGLSSNFVESLLEDREGDIWIGTARGLDRLRDPRIEIYSSANGLSSDLVDTVLAGRRGEIWLGTHTGLNLLAGGNIHDDSNIPNPDIISTYEDSAGTLWVGTAGGLMVGRGGRLSEVLNAGGQHIKRAFNIAEDSSGRIWVVNSGVGVLTVRGQTAYPAPIPPSETADLVTFLITRGNEIWLGHQKGGITVWCNGVVRHYSPGDGLATGLIRAFYEEPDGTIWVGTSNGLSRLRNSHWTTWTQAQGVPEGGVQGILDDGHGSLWLMTIVGVMRVSLDSLNTESGSLQSVLYGRAEGLRADNSMTNPRLSQSRDGKIWACTLDGAAVIEPSHLKRNPIPPPVVIEQVVADGRNYDPGLQGEVPFRGRDLEIVYTGISLMVPERVRFRYRLEGFKHDWVEAGTRRNVSYTNLRPGHYRFQVIACNNDGLWNTTGASLALRVDPYFYQTKWFAASCAISILLALWSAHRLRVRSVVSRLQLIAAERVRFSRELHDSLLQGFSGVVFLLDAAMHQFESSPDVAKQRLGRAVEQADQSLREAREMIASMRIPALENNTLPDALRTTATHMVSGMPVELHFEVKGHPQPTPYNIEANLYLLAREAVTNALNHASAKRIRLELAYLPGELRLTIQDDGVGFDVAGGSAKSGHWGLNNMRERARVIGARMQIDSAPGRGTTIEVVVRLKK